jgi:hypothetical protein
VSYRISTYDPIDDDAVRFACDWHLFAAGLSLWALRAYIRYLRSCGYDDQASILVERET